MRSFFKVCAITLVIILVSNWTNAATFTWTGGAPNNNWTSGGNWSGPSGSPTNGDDVIINNTGGFFTITVPNTVNNLASLTIKKVNLQLGTTLTVNGIVSIGATGVNTIVGNGSTSSAIIVNSSTSITDAEFNLNFTINAKNAFVQNAIFNNPFILNKANSGTSSGTSFISGSTFFQTSTINNNDITLLNLTGNTYKQSLTITNSSSSYIVVNGVNTFNSSVIVNNTSTGSAGYITIDGTNVFPSPVTFTNTSPGGILLASTSTNSFNSSVQSVTFNNNAVASTGNITIDGKNTYAGGKAQSNNNSPGYIKFTTSTGSNYNNFIGSDATFYSNGASPGYIAITGIATFSSACGVNVYNNGDFYLGGQGPSSAINVNGYGYFTNTGAGKLIIADGFNDVVNFNTVGASSKDVWFKNNSVGKIWISNIGVVNFNSNRIFLGNSTSAGTVSIGEDISSANLVTVKDGSFILTYPTQALAGVNPAFINGTLKIDRLVIDPNVPPKANLGSVIDLGVDATLDMVCRTTNVTQINRALAVSFYNCTSIAGEYSKTTSFTLLGTNSTVPTPIIRTNTCDLLTFNGDISFLNKSTNHWYIGGVGDINTGNSISTVLDNTMYFNSPGAPTTKSNVTLRPFTTGDLVFGYNPSTINFNSAVLNTIRTRNVIDITLGSLQIGVKANINLDVTSEIFIDQDALSNPCIANSNCISCATNTKKAFTKIALGWLDQGTGFGTFTFNGNFKKSAYFSGQADTKFLYGILSLGRFIAKEDLLIETPSSNVNSSAGIEISEFAIFEKNTNLNCPNIWGFGGIFGKAPATPTGPSSYTLTTSFFLQSAGVVDNYFTGSPVFNSALTISNYSTKGFFLGYATSDVFTFNSHVTLDHWQYLNDPKNIIRSSNLGTSYYKGNYTYTGILDAVSMAGTSIFNGTETQTISSRTRDAIPLANTVNFGFFEISKPLLNTSKVILASPVNVGGVAGSTFALTYGNIVSTSLSLLTVLHNTTPVGGGAHSFVEGPLAKEGDVAFKFHIGKPYKYFPLLITAPSSTSSSFTAEFFDQQFPISPNVMDVSIKDVMDCQYWQLISTGTASNVKVSLFWDNVSMLPTLPPANAQCYQMNPSLVAVAGYRNDNKWYKEGATIISQIGSESGYVESDEVFQFNYFALGYRNALVLNTYLTNPTKFKVFNNIENTFGKTFTSGPQGSTAGNKTILSKSKDVYGNIVLHPSFSSVVDILIDEQLSDEDDTDDKAKYVNYLPLNVKVTTSAENATNVVDHVDIDEDGDNTFLPLLSDMHKIENNVLSFYKEKQDANTFELTNNLSDAITYTVNRYITTPYTYFQITSLVPAGFVATLNIFDMQSNAVYSGTTLEWSAKSSPTAFYPEGLYKYEVQLTNGSISKNYKGQLILKHQ